MGSRIRFLYNPACRLYVSCVRPRWLTTQLTKEQILYALDTRQSTFLSDPVWQTVPWTNNPKTPFDQVYDFVTVAPELFSQGELLEYMDPQSQFRLATEMIAKCWETDRELAAVYDRLVENHPQPLYWPELALGHVSEEPEENGMLFPVAFHFRNLSVASTILVYWACQTMLWQGMYQLYRLIDELRDRFTKSDMVLDSGSNPDMLREPLMDPSSFNLRPLEHRTDFAAPACNILQSMEYCLMDEMKDHGPKSVAAPLWIAVETLRPYPEYQREVLWAEEARVKVQRRSLRILAYYNKTVIAAQQSGTVANSRRGSR